MRGRLTVGVMSLLTSLLAGCAASEHALDEQRASVIVARGYLESATLHRWPEACGGITDIELLGVINCVSFAPKSKARFVIEETIHGAPERKRLRVQFDYHSWWPDLKMRQPYLAVILSDGVLTELHEVAPLAPTADGRWAIPVTAVEDSPHFPCSREPEEPTPAPFFPRLRESIAELDVDEEDLEDYREDDAYTVEDGWLYANKGVLLDHAPAAYAGKSAAEIAGLCGAWM